MLLFQLSVDGGTEGAGRWSRIVTSGPRGVAESCVKGGKGNGQVS